MRDGSAEWYRRAPQPGENYGFALRHAATVEAQEPEENQHGALTKAEKRGTVPRTRRRPKVPEPGRQHGSGAEQKEADKEDYVTIADKLRILADGAKYDASCASSAAVRRGTPSGIGNSDGTGICHSYTPDGRCVSLLKILLTNFCIYDCQYCVNRVSSDVARARFTPQEVVDLTLEFYRGNYIEGLFLSSGIIQSPDYTTEQLVEVARRLRLEHAFGGYMHLKLIPGASPELVAASGLYADRLSANIELPTQVDLNRLAPEKTHESIEGTMAVVKAAVDESAHDRRTMRNARSFAPAGQTTQ